MENRYDAYGGYIPSTALQHSDYFTSLYHEELRNRFESARGHVTIDDINAKFHKTYGDAQKYQLALDRLVEDLQALHSVIEEEVEEANENDLLLCELLNPTTDDTDDWD